MVRINGYYSNEGLVEVYCNGQWGTICSYDFYNDDANLICRQLGYDSYSQYNHLTTMYVDPVIVYCTLYLYLFLLELVIIVSQCGVLG